MDSIFLTPHSFSAASLSAHTSVQLAAKTTDRVTIDTQGHTAMFSFHRKKPHEINHGIASYPLSSSTPASNYLGHSMASSPNTRTDKMSAISLSSSPGGHYEGHTNTGSIGTNSSNVSNAPMQYDSSFNTTLKKAPYRQQVHPDSGNRTSANHNISYQDQDKETYDTAQALNSIPYTTHSHSNSNPLPQQQQQQQPILNVSQTPKSLTPNNQYARPPSILQPKLSPNATSKRVWVRKNFHTATTITVGPNDIVDDLKYMIANKFPTTLALQVDPSDLVIRMIIPGDPSSNISGTNNNSSSVNNISGMATYHPVPRRPLIDDSHSPVSNNFSRVHQPPTIGQGLRSNTPISPDPAIHHKGDTSESNLSFDKSCQKTLALEPDVMVWSVLDRYFPHGMSMNDAFLVDYSNKGIIQNEDPNRPGQKNRGAALTSTQMRGGIRASIDVPDYGLNETRQQNLGGFTPGKVAILGDQKVPPPRLKKITSNETPSGPAPQPSAVILFSKDVRDSSKSPQSETTFPPPPPSPAMNNQNSPAHVQMSKIPPSRSSSSESQRKLNLKVNTDPRLDEKECSLKLQLDEPTATTPASGATAFTSTPNSDSTLTPQVTDLKLAKQPVKKKTSTDTKDKQGISKILNHINVLVVEDNLVNQKIMARHLKSCKVQFQIASTGKEALEIWKKGGFHLCFMDIQLPVMSGIEVTKEIRRLERLNHIGSISNHSNSNLNDNMLSEEDTLDLSLFRSPIIIVALTASTGASDQQDALAAGCNDYLTKPVQLKWLKNKLTEWGYMQALINYDFFRSEDS